METYLFYCSTCKRHLQSRYRAPFRKTCKSCLARSTERARRRRHTQRDSVQNVSRLEATVRYCSSCKCTKTAECFYTLFRKTCTMCLVKSAARAQKRRNRQRENEQRLCNVDAVAYDFPCNRHTLTVNSCVDARNTSQICTPRSENEPGSHSAPQTTQTKLDFSLFGRHSFSDMYRDQPKGTWHVRVPLWDGHETF